jgi:DNA repair exonuclease SbcCD ATPase subunit
MKCLFAALSLLWITEIASANAQTLEDRLRDQLRQTTEQLRQVQEGQASLQTRVTSAEGERDSLKKQVQALQAQTSRPRAAASDAELAALRQQVAVDRSALSQASTDVQAAQGERVRLQTLVSNQATMLAACRQKNEQLLKVSYEILDKFEHVDMWDTMNLAEPFVQDTRVNLEKIAQDYGDRIYDGKFDPRAVKLRTPQSNPAAVASPSAQPARQPAPAVPQPATPSTAPLSTTLPTQTAPTPDKQAASGQP